MFLSISVLHDALMLDSKFTETDSTVIRVPSQDNIPPDTYFLFVTFKVRASNFSPNAFATPYEKCLVTQPLPHNRLQMLPRALGELVK